MTTDSIEETMQGETPRQNKFSWQVWSWLNSQIDIQQPNNLALGNECRRNLHGNRRFPNPAFPRQHKHNVLHATQWRLDRSNCSWTGVTHGSKRACASDDFQFFYIRVRTFFVRGH
jgi:hypothetical protein